MANLNFKNTQATDTTTAVSNGYLKVYINGNKIFLCVYVCMYITKIKCL